MRTYLEPRLTPAGGPAHKLFTWEEIAGHITTVDPACRSVSAIEHRHIEAHKTWMAARPGHGGRKLSATTISHRLCLLRTFFERIIDWDYDDARRRSPIYAGDFPERDEPLPKFLDDPTGREVHGCARDRSEQAAPAHGRTARSHRHALG
jgi:hypothetical protein